MGAKKNKSFKIVTIVIFAFLTSCSPKFSKNALTFFFDGVPPNDSTKAESSQKVKNPDDNSDVFRAVPANTNLDLVSHYPYSEKECYSCHDEKSKSELIMPQPDLCYKCHDDFSIKYKFVHGPLTAGYCTACHNPHMSGNKKLLLRTGQQICLDCHESKFVLKNENHKDIADSECTLCHNPHGGENRFILN